MGKKKTKKENENENNYIITSFIICSIFMIVLLVSVEFYVNIVQDKPTVNAAITAINSSPSVNIASNYRKPTLSNSNKL